MNSKVSPRALKRMSLNSATAVPLHIVLNSSYIVISPASIIEGITYWYIVRRVRIAARGLFLIWSSFCAVLFPNDVPACFECSPIQSVLSELGFWPSFVCVAGRSCSSTINLADHTALWWNFTRNNFCPCVKKLLETWQFSRALYLSRCFYNANVTPDKNRGWWLWVHF